MEFKVLSINGDKTKHHQIRDWVASEMTYDVDLLIDYIKDDRVQYLVRLHELEGLEGYSLILLDIPSKFIDAQAIQKICERAPHTFVFTNILLHEIQADNYFIYDDNVNEFMSLLQRNRIGLNYSFNKVSSIMPMNIEAVNANGLYKVLRHIEKMGKAGNQNSDDLLDFDTSTNQPELSANGSVEAATTLNGVPELSALMSDVFSHSTEDEGEGAFPPFVEVEEDESQFYADNRNPVEESEHEPTLETKSVESEEVKTEVTITEDEEVEGTGEQVEESASEEVTEQTEQHSDSEDSEFEGAPNEEVAEENRQLFNEEDHQAKKTIESEQTGENLPLHDFSRAVQKRLINQKWNKHKTIAVWSPISRMGVTTFTINFASFLAENRMYTSVLEGVRSNVMLRHTLKRYMKQPQNWKSYASCIRELKIDGEGNAYIDPQVEVEWEYRDVKFIPLDDDDINLNWSQEMLQVYMQMPQLMDVTLIDLPSGEMNEISYATLLHVDTLLILVDDAFQEILAWKDYIHYIKEYFGIEVKLVFNKAYPFSDIKMLKSKMELEIIAEIPSLHEQVMQNYYHNRPILYHKVARTKLFPAYTAIAQNVFGEGFKLHTSAEKVSYDLSVRQHLPRKFKSLLQHFFTILNKLK